MSEISYDPSPTLARAGVESAAAILSAFSVAPAISIVDKAIVSNASGLEPLVPSLINSTKGLFTSPIQFLRQPSFLLIWGVYSGTYIVANNIQAFCERSGQNAFYPKFVGSSIANVTLSVLKDRAFARMFGTGAPKPMPMTSMGLFATRDSMTILASFSLPGIVSKQMQSSMGMNAQTADVQAQLVCPCAMQFLSCPLHLYGLDLYNNPESSRTNAMRTSFITKEYLKTALARIGRILPAFGIGGVINKEVRAQGKSWLQTIYGHGDKDKDIKHIGRVV